MSEPGGKSVPIEDDAAYWRQMYEERVALEDAGFSALLVDRDRYRDALSVVADSGWVEGDPIAMRDFARAVLKSDASPGAAR